MFPKLLKLSDTALHNVSPRGVNRKLSKIREIMRTVKVQFGVERGNFLLPVLFGFVSHAQVSLILIVVIAFKQNLTPFAIMMAI